MAARADEIDVATYRLTIEAGPGEAADLAVRLEALEPPAEAIGYFENSHDRWIVEAYFRHLPDKDHIERFLGQARTTHDHPFPVAVARLDESDWVAKSQSARPPVRVGGFFIHGAHDRGQAKGRRLAIEIDAGMAFGTAHHPTTTGCLEAFCELVRSGAVDRRTRVLDVGTGTGILAIATAKALAPCHVLAIDNDRAAVAIAGRNTRLNGVAGSVRVIHSEGVAGGSVRHHGRFGLIFANILAGPLREMARDMAGVVAPGGFVVLSGLLAHQAGSVEASYRAAGFAIERRLTRSQWTTLIMRRRWS